MGENRKNRNRKSEYDARYVMVEGTTKNEKVREIELSNKALEVLMRMKADAGEFQKMISSSGRRRDDPIRQQMWNIAQQLFSERLGWLI